MIICPTGWLWVQLVAPCSVSLTQPDPAGWLSSHPDEIETANAGRVLTREPLNVGHDDGHGPAHWRSLEALTQVNHVLKQLRTSAPLHGGQESSKRVETTCHDRLMSFWPFTPRSLRLLREVNLLFNESILPHLEPHTLNMRVQARANRTAAPTSAMMTRIQGIRCHL